MGFDFGIFDDEGLSEEFAEWLVNEKSFETRMRFGKLWEYYRNESYEASLSSDVEGKLNESGRCYVQAQEYGLPSRITGLVRFANGGVFRGRAVKDVQRKEVVVENDISWRINAMVDFLFGKPVNIVCNSPDRRKRAEIEAILKGVFEANGGVGFFQDMAVLGCVYGFVDCIIRPGEEVLGQGFLTRQGPGSLEQAIELAQKITLELIEAPRALPVLDENDYKKIRYYVQHFHQQKNSLSKQGNLFSRLLSGRESGLQRETVAVTEIMGPDAWQRYEDGELAAEGVTPWGILPVVHIQNIAQPYYYEGLSDVESLVPLQDELNTRLSDRASRITFQSFKMYLAKGIEGVENRPVSPGRMWCTDNIDASIDEFGGDSKAGSEEAHISEIREAMDKTSGVTPVVAGVLKSKLGNLTSAVALKLTLMGMLAKTERKKLTYGQGLKSIGRIVLEILDQAGIYNSTPADRDLGVIFPSPLPENVMEKLNEAQIKKELGVPQEEVLKELGY